MALRRVRAVLHELHSVVFDRLDREDADALVDFFSIPKPIRRGKEGELFLVSRPISLKLDPGLSGSSAGPAVSPFSRTRPCAGDISTKTPYPLRLRCPLRQSVPALQRIRLQFLFHRHRVLKAHADCWPTDFNEFDMVARQLDFRVDVVGFDSIGTLSL